MSQNEVAVSGSNSRLRAFLKRFSLLRHVYYISEAALDRLRRVPADVAADCELLYSSRPDPWDYVSQDQQDRYQQALLLIRHHCGEQRRRDILELGCGEGIFSVLVAGGAHRMLCADRSATALKRAAERLASRPQVELLQFDILSDHLDQRFDLVIADHLIDLFHRPNAYLTVARVIVSSLAPGGIALVGVMRASPLVEAAWWSRPLLRGGLAILDWARGKSDFAQLQHVERMVGRFYIYDVYRRPC